jgi:spore coat protein CotH
VFLQFEASNWEEELAARYHTGRDLPAAVTIDGRTYRDVGVRFRGNSSYRMVPAGLKRSLNLSFDVVHADQSVGGYNTLNLLNANNDPTFVRTVLYSEIARKYMPAPKVNFMRVVINGESWGVYANAQQFNKDFLRDFYGSTRGVRWKAPGSPRGRAGLEYLGDAVDPYRSIYELKSKDEPKAWSDLIRLCRLLNTTAPAHLEEVLAPHLNIDGALRFLALDVALVNSDGYWTRASDYSLFQDAAGRFHVLPYDFNEALGVQGGGRRGGGSSGPTLDPLVGADDLSKPLRARLLAVPALRKRYLEYVRDIADRWMDWNTLSPIVAGYQRLIEADVKADGRKLYGFEGFNPASLQRFFDQRRTFLLQQQEGQND